MENKVYKYKENLYSNDRYIDDVTYFGDLGDLISILMDDEIIEDYHGEYWVEGDHVGYVSETSEEELLDFVADYTMEIERIEKASDLN